MDAFQLALEQGEKALADAQNQQKKLALEISQLEAIVTQLRAYLGRGGNGSTPLFNAKEPIVAAVTPPTPTNQTENRPPLWKAIVNALNGKKGDFSVPEALHALERTGRIIESQNRLNIIRNTLIQREDIFGRLGTGHYFVRGFEAKPDETAVVKAAEKKGDFVF